MGADWDEFNERVRLAQKAKKAAVGSPMEQNIGQCVNCGKILKDGDSFSIVKSDVLRCMNCEDLTDWHSHGEWHFEPSDPIQHILKAMELAGLRNPDLYDIFGSKARTSEILNYKRPLRLRHVLPLHQRLGIPLLVLVQPYEEPSDATGAGVAKGPLIRN